MNASRPIGGLLLLLTVAGCAAPRLSPPDVDALGARPPVAEVKPKLPDVLAQLLDAPPPTDQRPEPTTPPRNVLVLSGGGKDGAFSAGVLTGWTATGKRPTFDVVTGVSTGALIAPLAFLGAGYDAMLQENYTGVRTKDVYHMRPWLSVLWSDALADSSPLQRRIEQQVTDEFLAEIAQAHVAGRRLYVGTTNLDTGRLVYWDMGAIAAGTDPNKRDLFRKVLLASCSIPGLLPPVPIEIELDGRRFTELHVDGGVSAAMFLTPCMVLGADGSGAGTTVYVVVAGKLAPETRSVDRRFIAVTGEAFQELLKSQTRGDLLRVFLLTRLTGGRFAFLSAPQELPMNGDATRFDPEEMRRLFGAGAARGADGTAWRTNPPGVNPEEWCWPRTGAQFTTPTPNSSR